MKESNFKKNHSLIEYVNASKEEAVSLHKEYGHNFIKEKESSLILESFHHFLLQNNYEIIFQEKEINSSFKKGMQYITIYSKKSSPSISLDRMEGRSSLILETQNTDKLNLSFYPALTFENIEGLYIPFSDMAKKVSFFPDITNNFFEDFFRPIEETVKRIPNIIKHLQKSSFKSDDEISSYLEEIKRLRFDKKLIANNKKCVYTKTPIRQFLDQDHPVGLENNLWSIFCNITYSLFHPLRPKKLLWFWTKSPLDKDFSTSPPKIYEGLTKGGIKSSSRNIWLRREIWLLTLKYFLCSHSDDL
jgi:hypothetical protein